MPELNVPITSGGVVPIDLLSRVPPLDFSFDLSRAATDQKGRWIIEGYVTTTELASDGIRILPEALAAAKDDLMKRPSILFNHNPDLVIGRVLETSVDEKGLLVKALISREEESLWKKIQEGVLSKFSVRGKITGAVDEWDAASRKITRVATAIELYEASIVSVPGAAGADITKWYVERSRKEVKEMPEPEIKVTPPAAAPAPAVAPAAPAAVPAAAVAPPPVEIVRGESGPDMKPVLDKLNSIMAMVEKLMQSQPVPVPDAQRTAVPPAEPSEDSKKIAGLVQEVADLKRAIEKVPIVKGQETIPAPPATKTEEEMRRELLGADFDKLTPQEQLSRVLDKLTTLPEKK
jgi:HK97 family phage prohead protease